MKRHLLLLTVAGLSFSLGSCSYPSGNSRINWVSTSQVVRAPGVIGPLTTVNGVALHHYDPDLYSPFVYDHRALSHNTYYRERALRAAQRGSVHVGPMAIENASE
jgi:hypothetical protein